MNWIENFFKKLKLQTKVFVLLLAYTALLALSIPTFSHSIQNSTSGLSLVLALSIFSLPVVALVSFLFGKHLTKPISTIKKGSQEIADGNFSGRITETRGDDFQELYDSYNEMAFAFQQYQDQQTKTRKKVKELAMISKEDPKPVLRLDHTGTVIFKNDAVNSIPFFEDLRTGQSFPQELLEQFTSGLESENKKEFEWRDNNISYYVFVVANQELKTKNIYFWNITKQKQAEEKLIEARDRAIELSQVKSKFLATMSHEIRTPMNGIIGLSGILMDTPLNEEQKELTQSIIISSTSLLSIINDILDFSKIEAGKMTIEYTPFDLEALIKDSVDLFKVSIQDKKIDLKYKVIGSCPKQIESDPSRLRQILVNLIGNAVKFTDKGSVCVKVHCEEDKKVSDQYRVWFEVADTGMGIPYEQQHRLFQDFSQVDGSITRKFGGTGLGLAICQSLVGLLGGSIWAESTPNEGSSFFFSIVAKEALMPEHLNENGKLSDALDQTFAKLYPLKIAVAEDNPVNQLVIKKFLKKLGYAEISIYENGYEIQEACSEVEYDIVLMDMEMPVMSGIEATQEIRQNTPDGPFITAMTANAMEEDKNRCLAAGMNSFVAKPIRINELAAALKEGYKQSRSKKAA